MLLCLEMTNHITLSGFLFLVFLFVIYCVVSKKLNKYYFYFFSLSLCPQFVASEITVHTFSLLKHTHYKVHI